jgi:putative ABC transport system substrate-binding protein
MIALLVNPNIPVVIERITRDMEEAARAKGVQLPILKAGSESEIDAAFASLVQLQAGALLVAADPFLSSRREQLVALAARHAVPAIYAWREFAASGGLISYGPTSLPVFRQLGTHAEGSRAPNADHQSAKPTTFELVSASEPRRRSAHRTAIDARARRGHQMEISISPTHQASGALQQEK